MTCPYDEDSQVAPEHHMHAHHSAWPPVYQNIIFGTKVNAFNEERGFVCIPLYDIPVHREICRSLVGTTNFAESNQSNNREIELSNFETNKDFLP